LINTVKQKSSILLWRIRHYVTLTVWHARIWPNQRPPIRSAFWLVRSTHAPPLLYRFISLPQLDFTVCIIQRQHGEKGCLCPKRHRGSNRNSLFRSRGKKKKKNVYVFFYGVCL